MVFFYYRMVWFGCWLGWCKKMMCPDGQKWCVLKLFGHYVWLMKKKLYLCRRKRLQKCLALCQLGLVLCPAAVLFGAECGSAWLRFDI